MIKLSFLFPSNNQIMNFKVDRKNIYYTDNFWKNWLRIIPKDKEFIRKVIASRNKIPTQIITMFNLTKEDKMEYENAKTEKELAEIIIKDCKAKGLRLIWRR
ncbi:MAG TPA: hypothetical protein VGB37_16420 [Candidatus Lokiarchaeia archaeon]